SGVPTVWQHGLVAEASRRPSPSTSASRRSPRDPRRPHPDAEERQDPGRGPPASCFVEATGNAAACIPGARRAIWSPASTAESAFDGAAVMFETERDASLYRPEGA